MNKLSLWRPSGSSFEVSVPKFYLYSIFPDSLGRSTTLGFGGNSSSSTIDLLIKKASYGSPSDEPPLVLIKVKKQVARCVQCDKVEHQGLSVQVLTLGCEMIGGPDLDAPT